MEPEAIIIDPEFKALIPPLTGDERRDLEASLKADGCISPLVVWYEHHILLDGHNRHELCRKHDIECEVHEIVLDSREAAKAWIIRNQLGRRNLNESQRALLAAALADIYAVQAKGRMSEGGKLGGKSPAKGVANLPPSSTPGKARDEAAAAMNVSPRLVQAAKTVKEKGTAKLQESVRSGEISVSAAAEVARLPKARQDRIVSRGPKEVVRAAGKARRQRAASKGAAKGAFKPVRGHSNPPPMVPLSLPRENAEMAANTLIDLFDAEWLSALVRRIEAHLESTNPK